VSRKDAKRQRKESFCFALQKKGRDILTENELSKDIVDAAIKIHRALGAGLLESVYEVVLAHELES